MYNLAAKVDDGLLDGLHRALVQSSKTLYTARQLSWPPTVRNSIRPPPLERSRTCNKIKLQIWGKALSPTGGN